MKRTATILATALGTLMLTIMVLDSKDAHAASDFDVPSTYGLEFPSILRGGEFSYLFSLLKRECAFVTHQDTASALGLLRTMDQPKFTSGEQEAGKIYPPMLKELGKEKFCQKAYKAYGPKGQGNVHR
jgi:hypothetical protein